MKTAPTDKKSAAWLAKLDLHQAWANCSRDWLDDRDYVISGPQGQTLSARISQAAALIRQGVREIEFLYPEGGVAFIIDVAHPSQVQLPSDLATPESGADLKVIEKECSLRKQLVAALELHSTATSTVAEALPRLGKKSRALRDLQQRLTFFQEGFNCLANPVRPGEIDRKCSMLSGPFFTTAKFEVPRDVDSDELLYPMVQLNLAAVSAATGVALGAGLLQLWWCTSQNASHVRVVPASEVARGKPTPFPTDFGPFQFNDQPDSCPEPRIWGSWPHGDRVAQLVAIESTGLEGPDLPLEEECSFDCQTDWERTGKPVNRLLENLHKACTAQRPHSVVRLMGSPREFDCTDKEFRGARRLVCVDGRTELTVFYSLSSKGKPKFFVDPNYAADLSKDGDDEPDLSCLPRDLRLRSLARPDCPRAFMEWALRKGSEAEKLAVIKNARAPDDLIEDLAQWPGKVGEAAGRRLAAA